MIEYLTIPRDLLESLVDDDPCYFDHHGGCQAHGYISLKHGEMCPHQEAKQYLAKPRGDDLVQLVHWVLDSLAPSDNDAVIQQLTIQHSIGPNAWLDHVRTRLERLTK